MQQPKWGQDRLAVEVSRAHKIRQTHPVNSPLNECLDSLTDRYLHNKHKTQHPVPRQSHRPLPTQQTQTQHPVPQQYHGPLPTQQTQNTTSMLSAGRTRNPHTRVAAVLRLRPRGHCDRQVLA